MTLLNLARKLLRRAGIEAHRANPMTMWELRLSQLLVYHRMSTVLDVGANDGGFASGLLSGGYKGRIISFEPLPDVWATLQQRSREHPNWSIAPRMALSDEHGETDFHEAGNSVSSSLLTMTCTHVEAAPESRTVSTIRVPTGRLDDVLPELDCDDPVFLKLDVQGAERMVLEGARHSLTSSIAGVQLEMSLTSLYDGQASAASLDELLRGLGFECWDILPGFRDPKSLRMLQYDGVYFRRSPTTSSQNRLSSTSAGASRRKRPQ